MRTERLEAAEIAQIYKLWKEYSAAINSGNMERWIALWHSDGVLLLPNLPQLCGKSEIWQYSNTHAEVLPMEFSINPDVVHISGDHAYAHGAFSSLLAPGGKCTTRQISGKFLSVLIKQDNGSWKIVVDCFNYDRVSEQDDPASNL